MPTRPVWVEISRRNLVANYLELRRIVRNSLASAVAPASAEVLAVVKANAYGHGMRECAPLLVEAGAKWIGVTSVEEGVSAREVCPHADILVMSGLWHGEADALIEHRLTPFVWEDFHFDLIEEAAQRQGLPPRSIPVHLELDTGMSRQGVSLVGSALAQRLQRFHPRSALRLDGIATHFSAPEVCDGVETARQCARLEASAAWVAAAGLHPEWLHAGNSATISRPEPLRALQQAAARLGAQLMLRPGISLYGYAPRFTEGSQIVAAPTNLYAGLRPVLSWKTRVTSLRTIDAGDSAGYNSTFRATHPTRLALLPMGYADGLNRLLSNRGSMLVRGHRAPIAGRISMDQTLLDVTGIAGVAIGDEVAVIGAQGEEAIDAYELADLDGTIPYEVLCAIAARVPRVLVD